MPAQIGLNHRAPNGAAGLELCLSIFDGYDLDSATKMLFVGMVQNAVITAALNDALEGRSRERLDMTEEEVMGNVELILDGIAARLPQ